jgi:hypothetical protein
MITKKEFPGMYNLIAHRRNTIEELRATPVRYGVEVDIRSCGERLIIHHDPLTEGIDFLSCSMPKRSKSVQENKWIPVLCGSGAPDSRRSR